MQLFTYFLYESGYLAYWPAFLVVLVTATAIVYALRRRSQLKKHPYTEWRRSSFAIAFAFGGFPALLVCFFAGYHTQHHWRPGMELTDEVRELDEACKAAGFKTIHQYNGWSALLPAEVFSDKFLGSLTRNAKPVAVALYLDKSRERGEVVWMELVDALGEHISHPFLRLPAAEARGLALNDPDRYFYRDRDPSLTFRGEDANKALRLITESVKKGGFSGHLEVMDADMERGAKYQRAKAKAWSDSSWQSTKKQSLQEMNDICKELREEGKIIPPKAK